MEFLGLEKEFRQRNDMNGLAFYSCQSGSGGKGGRAGATARSKSGQGSHDVFRSRSVRADKSKEEDWEKTDGQNSECEGSQKRAVVTCEIALLFPRRFLAF